MWLKYYLIIINMRKTVQKCHQNLLQKTKMCFSFWGNPDPLPGLPPDPAGRSVPEASCHLCTWGTCPPDSIVTVVNSLQNRVNSITLCITLNAKTGKIVLVTLYIQIEWLFCNVRLVWNFPSVERRWAIIIMLEIIINNTHRNSIYSNKTFIR